MKEYIYSILSKSTGKIYIGRSYQPKQRFLNHISCLKRKVHTSKKLQEVFDLYGKGDLLFDIVDVSNPDRILDLEEQWISKVDPKYSLNITLKSTGGRKLSAEQRKERALNYCEILDIGFETRIGLNKLAKKFGVSSGALVEYKPEWEELRGVQYGNPQVKSAKERFAVFADAIKEEGIAVLHRLKDFRVSARSIQKYSPEFGIDVSTLRLDGWKGEAREKAFAAFEYKAKTNCSVQEAMKHTGATTTTYYKYLPEWKGETGAAMSSAERAASAVKMVESGEMHMHGACKHWRIGRDTIKKYFPHMFK